MAINMGLTQGVRSRRSNTAYHNEVNIHSRVQRREEVERGIWEKAQKKVHMRGWRGGRVRMGGHYTILREREADE